jgi:hypothetical protein
MGSARSGLARSLGGCEVKHVHYINMFFASLTNPR